MVRRGDYRKRVVDPEGSAPMTTRNKTARVSAKNQSGASEVAEKSTCPTPPASTHQLASAEAIDADIPSLCELASKMDLSQQVSPLSNVLLGEALFTLSNLTKMYNSPDALTKQLVQLLHSLAPEKFIDPTLMLDVLKVAETQFTVPTPKIENICSDERCATVMGKSSVCPNCRHILSSEPIDQAYRIENNLSEIIKDLFENQGLAKLLEEGADRLKGQKQNGTLKDITDGFRYSTLPKVSKYDISFIFHADFHKGADEQEFSTFTSVLSIAELEPSVRAELLILFSIWRFPDNPYYYPFVFTNFYQTMEHLSTKGIDWTHPETKVKMNSKAFLLCCSVEQEMRNLMQNMVSPSADYSCSFCEKQHFECFVAAEKTDWEVRTHANVTKNAFKVASGMLKQCKGVKGVSPLSFVPYFDIVNGFTVEYMENIITSAVERNIFQCIKDKEDLEKALDLTKKISYQSPISKLDKSKNDLNCYQSWTAKERRNWLLYYSVPCLQDVCSADLLELHCLLVKGVYNLLKDDVQLADLEQSKKLLSEYCRRYKELYQQDVLEHHTLLHFVQNVQQCGPLWSTSSLSCQGVFDFVKQKFSDVDDEEPDCNLSILTLVAKELNSLTSMQMLNTKLGPKADFILTGEAHTKPKAESFDFKLQDGPYYLKATVKGFSLESYLQGTSHLSYFLFYQHTKKGVPVLQAAKLVYFFKDNGGSNNFKAKGIQLLQPLFQNDAVTLDHLRLFEETDTVYTESVDQIDRPLFLMGNILCIPPNIFKGYNSL